MSQKNHPRRGRPRSFSADDVLEVARDLFWDRGLADVSLDELSAATGVARPSLAAAFGDKRSLYLRAIGLFAADMAEVARAALGARHPLKVELMAFYGAMLDRYLSGKEGRRGCFAISTMPAEALHDQEIRATLAKIVAESDAALTKRFRVAAVRGELHRGVDARSRGILAVALLHSLAVRARAGSPRSALQALARSAVAHLAGA